MALTSDQASPSRSWWRLSLPCPLDVEESLFWKLSELGVQRIAVQHQPETPELKTLIAWLPSPDWPNGEREQLMESLRPLAETFDACLGTPLWEEVADEDWSLSWKQHWQPDPVGEKLLILPAWLEAPDELVDRLVLRMDPGSAFGTGSHPTTRLCLEALEDNPPVGARVADLGCGSGVLSLAAVALGAKQVFAADTDSLAVRATAENAELNGLQSSQLQVVEGSLESLRSILDGTHVDLLLCNILAPVIEELAPGFESLVSKGGQALLSGLLIEQAPHLIAILEGLGWRPQALEEQGRWGLMKIART